MTQRQIHNLDISEVWTLLRSRSEGLRPDEVAQRLAEIGTNTLGPPPRWGWLRTLLQQSRGMKLRSGREARNPWRLWLSGASA